MNLTSEFFAKLRRVAVTLETETSKLQAAFEHGHNNSHEDSSGDSAARGMRAYHELNCEVQNIKEQIQDEVAQRRTHVNEVSRFIKDCEETQKKLSEDIRVIKTHWEKYGYQPPIKTETKSDAKNHSTKEEAVTDDGDLSLEVDSQEETGAEVSPERPTAPPVDPMRTPQLSDFGLSEVNLKRALVGGAWCSEVLQMPEVNLPVPVLKTPARPTMAITPKRALCMDEDELLTPQMHDFGISEYTMAFGNDFTMNLQLKDAEKTKKTQQTLLQPPVNPVIENMLTNDDLESPEPPVFCTPGFKIKKAHPVTESSSESPAAPAQQPSTPDVPAFQTPYVNRLLSLKESEKKPEPAQMESDDDKVLHASISASKCNKDFGMPQLKIEDMMSCDLPEMPDLESNLGNSLLTRSAKMQKNVGDREKTVINALELDGPTQEFNLKTPRVRREYEEPRTPEMPDLSSVTQDICKLLSQTKMKKIANAERNPHEKENTSPPRRFDTLSLISEQEFQCLPSYLRQMSLSSLNQAIDNINHSIAKCRRDKREFHIDELKLMIDLGAKTPLFILCLSELKRMIQIRGGRNNAVYELETH